MSDAWQPLPADWLDAWLRDELPQKVQQIGAAVDAEFPGHPHRDRWVAQFAGEIEGHVRALHAKQQLEHGRAQWRARKRRPKH